MTDLPSTSSPDSADREIVSTRVIDAPRDRIFGAFRDPQILAQWWGPNGFRNTFETFDFRPGGQWRFVMHGPDGTDYKNESIFVEIEEPERIVLDHVCAPKFRLSISLDAQDDKTVVTWRMVFLSVEECARLRALCTEANQQNFDRLETALKSAV